MYGMFTYIYHKHQLNVGKISQSHGSYGKQVVFFSRSEIGRIPKEKWGVKLMLSASEGSFFVNF